MNERITELEFESCKIIYKNFSGKEVNVNRPGNRNFCVVLENEDAARAMKNDGWNVKLHNPRNEDDNPFYYLSVAVAYGTYPPNIFMVVKKPDGRMIKTLLDETTVGMLDESQIENVDLIVRPYQWEVNGMHGVKAYVKEMYVTVRENRFAAKYDYQDPTDDLPFDV